MLKFDVILGVLMLLFVSCESDTYSSGDGSLSYVTTDFGEVHYDSDGRAFKFVTDADSSLIFATEIGKPDKAHAGKADRSLLYYNITEKKGYVQPITLVPVLTTNVIDKSKVKDPESDPLTVESVWMSPNGKYLNLSLKLKTSTPDDKNIKHVLGMLYEGVNDGTVSLKLIHDQKNIPANYSVHCYLSIRTSSFINQSENIKTANVKANTFEGLKTFNIELQ